MSLLEQIAPEIRLVFLALLGLVYGAFANWGVYELAYNRRPISPWSKQPRDCRACWFDLLPLVGWITWRRHSDRFGRWFWVRPVVVELACAFFVPWLYWWEVLEGRLLPAGIWTEMSETVHLRYVFHLVLFWLMLVGSLIDLDEKTLPDAVTLPGTLFALVFVTVFPVVAMPVPAHVSGTDLGTLSFAWQIEYLHLASPNRWPEWLAGQHNYHALFLAVALWLFWCFALMERRWYRRVHGWRAWQFFFAGLLRRLSTWVLLALGLVGALLIGLVWLLDGQHWQALVSAIVSMVVSGALIWVIRLLAGGVLGREAMGFGDVTLMGMMGAFLGWQPCLLVLFLACFLALGIGVVGLALRGEPEIPFGPFLCLAAALIIIFWPVAWQNTSYAFSLGLILWLVLGVCLAVLPALLVLVRFVLELLGL